MTWCADIDDAALERAGKAHPGTRLTKQYKDLLVADDCDAIIVTAPTEVHEEIARAALAARKPVLIEKPLTDSWESAESLAREAQKSGVVNVTGHVYLFNPAVRYICGELERGALGTIRYMTSSRMGFGLIRADVDALWDLAPHDLSMFLTFIKAMPTRVAALGSSYIRADRSDVNFFTLEFPGDVIASVRVSWDYPFKERHMMIVGSRGTIDFDDLAVKKISVYRCEQDAPLNRDGYIEQPELEQTEPLYAQVRHFIDSIERRELSHVDFRAGADVVRVLHALSESAARGVPVDLEPALS
jgi:predicted dehydrogenase